MSICPESIYGLTSVYILMMMLDEIAAVDDPDDQPDDQPNDAVRHE